MQRRATASNDERSEVGSEIVSETVREVVCEIVRVSFS